MRLNIPSRPFEIDLSWSSLRHTVRAQRSTDCVQRRERMNTLLKMYEKCTQRAKTERQIDLRDSRVCARTQVPSASKKASAVTCTARYGREYVGMDARVWSSAHTTVNTHKKARMRRVLDLEAVAPDGIVEETVENQCLENAANRRTTAYHRTADVSTSLAQSLPALWTTVESWKWNVLRCTRWRCVVSGWKVGAALGSHRKCVPWFQLRLAAHASPSGHVAAIARCWRSH